MKHAAEIGQAASSTMLSKLGSVLRVPRFSGRYNIDFIWRMNSVFTSDIAQPGVVWNKAFTKRRAKWD